MARDREDLPFGARGEWAVPAVQAAPPPPPVPFEIPRPDWNLEARERAERDQAQAADLAPRPDALAALRAEAGDELPPLNLAPPVVLEPLLPVRFPPPDFRAEELERARREHDERALAEETPGRYPPPTREAS
jgi:hypothetical protein